MYFPLGFGICRGWWNQAGHKFYANCLPLAQVLTLETPKGYLRAATKHGSGLVLPVLQDANASLTGLPRSSSVTIPTVIIPGHAKCLSYCLRARLRKRVSRSKHARTLRMDRIVVCVHCLSMRRVYRIS